MPLIDQYSPNSYLRVLLQGSPGSGKTTTACQFPRPWIIDCDHNVNGALLWLKQNNKLAPVGFDWPDEQQTKLKLDVSSKKNLADEKAAAQFIIQLEAAAIRTDIDTIIVDGMTKVNDYFKAQVLQENPTKTGGFEQTSWSFYRNKWFALCSWFLSVKKHIVLVAHEKVDKDELDGSTRLYLNQQGAFKDEAGMLFTDVWRCEVGAVGSPPKPQYLVRTEQSYRHSGLKNGLGLPPTFVFDWNVIEKRLKGEK